MIHSAGITRLGGFSDCPIPEALPCLKRRAVLSFPATMKHPILVLGLLFSAVVLSAQTPTPPRAPAPAPVLSPEIHADRRVTFRLRASNASKVTVSGQFTKALIALTKGAEGLWSVTVDAVAPG